MENNKTNITSVEYMNSALVTLQAVDKAAKGNSGPLAVRGTDTVRSPCSDVAIPRHRVKIVGSGLTGAFWGVVKGKISRIS